MLLVQFPKWINSTTRRHHDAFAATGVFFHKPSNVVHTVFKGDPNASFCGGVFGHFFARIKCLCWVWISVAWRTGRRRGGDEQGSVACGFNGFNGFGGFGGVCGEIRGKTQCPNPQNAGVML